MRVGRVAAVTASIALVGAIIGGVIGGALMSIWSAVLPGTTDDGLTVALLGAGAGAVIGAVLAPITAWVFLRRVPLGRAILHTTIGTTLGATLGLVLGMLGIPRYGAIPGGLVLAGTIVGFLVAAVRLRMKTRAPAVGAKGDGGAH